MHGESKSNIVDAFIVDLMEKWNFSPKNYSAKGAFFSRESIVSSIFLPSFRSVLTFLSFLRLFQTQGVPFSWAGVIRREGQLGAAESKASCFVLYNTMIIPSMMTYRFHRP